MPYTTLLFIENYLFLKNYILAISFVKLNHFFELINADGLIDLGRFKYKV